MTGYNVEPVVASEAAVAGGDRRSTTARGSRRQRAPSSARGRAVDARRGGRARSRRCRSTIRTATSRCSPRIEELERCGARAAERRGAGRQARQPHADVGHPKGASDIHIEPYEKESGSGTAWTASSKSMTPPHAVPDAIISRIKIMAKMDIAEKRLPQDGASSSGSKTTASARRSTSASRRCRRSTARRS